MRTSRSPTTVMTANGEVQTREEATENAKQLDLFVTVMLLEETPAVLSLGKLCEDHGYSYEWANGQKPCLIKNSVWINCNKENNVPIVVPGLSTPSSSSSSSATPKSPPQESKGSTPFPVSIDSGRADEHERGNADRDPAKKKTIKKMWITHTNGVTPSSSEIREWLQKFRESLVDESVPEPHGARVPEERSLEALRRVVTAKHSIYSHSPKDRNCEICQRTNDFWSISGDFTYHHHVEPRVKLHTPREESFPIPLKYIDVTRVTHTTLDVLQESRIDDYWDIDGLRDLSDSWTGFTQFSLLKEKPPEGYMWSGWRLTKRQATSRPDHLWPEIWRSMSRNAKMKEKQNWASERPKLENARKLRGMYFIDPEDKDFAKIIQNARKKLEIQTLLLCPARGQKSGTMTCIQKDDHKSRLTCILEANETERLRMEGIEPRIHEDHIAGKGDNSLHHYNLVHKFIPMPQAMNLLAAKEAVDKKWGQLEKISAWNLAKVRNMSEMIEEARHQGAKVHFASWMVICHLKNSEWEKEHQKY